MRFFKLQATGNDFVFVFNESKSFSAKEVQGLCDRHYGIGADGFVALSSTPMPQQFRWTFYNPDGKEAEMCGNAARAATLLIYKLQKQKQIHVQTKVGTFQGTTETDQLTTIEMTLPARQIQKIAPLFRGQFPQGYLTNTGVPHCVIPVSDLAMVTERTKELAPMIFDPVFGTQGANLTFFSVKSEAVLQVVTLERGVNDFTLSCGTGVIAAAQVYSHLENKKSQISIQTPGGPLWVDFPADEKARLRGETRFVFEGSWE